MAYVVQAQDNASVSGHEPGDSLDETRFSEAKIQKMLDSGAIVEGVAAAPKRAAGRPKKSDAETTTSEGDGTPEDEKTE